MGAQKWLYDMLLYIYALSLLFYFSDFIQPSRRAKQIGTGLLVFVWVLQTGFLIFLLAMDMKEGLISPFEYWLGFTWLLITITLVISRFLQIDLVLFFVNVIGFAVLALNLYSYAEVGKQFAVWQTVRELLIVHITLVLCAYVVLTLGFIFSVMYLLLHWHLKTKRWTPMIRRFPGLETIQSYMDRCVIIGLPLLALSLAIAVTSILIEARVELLLDMKVIASFATLFMFIVYVYQRARLNRGGKRLARWYMLSFVILLISLLANYASSFH